ncbi:MAG: D-alanyl-lipoteichoic acid biosynthesis protein DltD [Streptococcaceae bacterium]|jgi:D-alanine transfer protein|nr:D-alanyl-lipoteichoic acid biosynthesis protein DltD [Streptococcaceae bacterium]
MKRKLFKALGPLVVALIMVAVLMFLPLNIGAKYSHKQLTKFGQAPYNTPSFTGYSIKKQAFSNSKFLPILGSSELGHVDSFHPSVYFTKYPAGFTPYLAGQPGTTSLTQFFFVKSAAEQLKNRKMVFIISPQWFTGKGVTNPELTNFVSKGEIYSWLISADPKAETTAKLAKHLLNFNFLKSEGEIHHILKRFSQKKAMTKLQKLKVSSSLQFWRQEDLLFSGISQWAANQMGLHHKIDKLSKKLPKNPNFDELDALAYSKGEKASSNNPYRIRNAVWKKIARSKAKTRKGRLANASYLKSPEYTDFQQLLNVFAENHDDVLFVIQPVNGSWYEYLGLTEQKLQEFSSKIRQQLSSQGFNQIADFTSMYNTPYAIDDTIHFGNRGWLAVDQEIKKFMESPSKIDYHLDNERYLSEDWAMNK